MKNNNLYHLKQIAYGIKAGIKAFLLKKAIRKAKKLEQKDFFLGYKPIGNVEVEINLQGVLLADGKDYKIEGSKIIFLPRTDSQWEEWMLYKQ